MLGADIARRRRGVTETDELARSTGTTAVADALRPTNLVFAQFERSADHLCDQVVGEVGAVASDDGLNRAEWHVRNLREGSRGHVALAQNILERVTDFSHIGGRIA